MLRATTFLFLFLSYRLWGEKKVMPAFISFSLWLSQSFPSINWWENILMVIVNFLALYGPFFPWSTSYQRVYSNMSPRNVLKLWVQSHELCRLRCSYKEPFTSLLNSPLHTLTNLTYQNSIWVVSNKNHVIEFYFSVSRPIDWGSSIYLLCLKHKHPTNNSLSLSLSLSDEWCYGHCKKC